MNPPIKSPKSSRELDKQRKRGRDRHELLIWFDLIFGATVCVFGGTSIFYGGTWQGALFGLFVGARLFCRAEQEIGLLDGRYCIPSWLDWR